MAQSDAVSAISGYYFSIQPPASYSHPLIMSLVRWPIIVKPVQSAEALQKAIILPT
jgi:hypothetical protein